MKKILILVSVCLIQVCLAINVFAEDLHMISANYISQVGAYPNGCEAVSTVMALNYAGIEIDCDTFIDEYMPKQDQGSWEGSSCGADPDLVYAGDPRRQLGSFGCNSPVMVSTAKTIAGERANIFSENGLSLNELCEKYIDNNIPVIVWGTIGMDNYSAEEHYIHWTTTSGKSISYNLYQHCLLLVGYDANNYYFNDPIMGAGKAYSKARANKAYDLLGCQNVVIIPTGIVEETTASTESETTNIQSLETQNTDKVEETEFQNSGFEIDDCPQWDSEMIVEKFTNKNLHSVDTQNNSGILPDLSEELTIPKKTSISVIIISCIAIIVLVILFRWLYLFWLK